MNDAGMNLLTSPMSRLEAELRPPVTIGQSAGSLLSRARHEKDWSVQQVADQLKLSLKQIVALESDQFEALPKMVIVRGFVRTYAKLLKIDADPLIALLPKDIQDEHFQATLKPALSTPFLESRLSLMGRQDSNYKYLFGAALLAILAAGFFAAQKTDIVDLVKGFFGRNNVTTHEMTPVSNFTPPIILAAPVLISETKDLQLINSVVSIPVTAGNNPQANQNLEEQTQAASATGLNIVNKKDAKNISDALPIEVVQPPSIPVFNKEVMRLKFHQDSWLQVKKENGVILTSHLARAGTEETFSVKEALQVRIGNAAGVEGVLRGAPLEIMADKGSNVVNLNVK
ncbi:MAG: DUF4115 domain-containing protein [Cytophaga sp.]|nr:DUF4115 domain-containing protein [Undibacterium sp.]